MPDYSKGKIYIIQNDINDIVYIGQTIQSLSKRYWQHAKLSNTHSWEQSKLNKAMCELGRKHFFISLLEKFPCTNKSELCNREYYYIRKYRETHKLYNTNHY